MRKILELKGISKQFPGVKALDQVHLNVYEGKVMALLGENGAGKSTLMKILSGVYQPDAGSLWWHGSRVLLSGVHAAKKLGISFIHQELSLIPKLSIAENIFLDELPTTKLGRIRWKEVYRKAGQQLQTVQVQRDTHLAVQELSIGEQQLVEIAKNLAKNSRIVIMDEPTDALTNMEVANLFRIIRKLKESGKSIIYITHRLDEVFQICDDVSILRDGAFICEAPSGEMDENKLIKAMVGRELNEQFPQGKQCLVDKPVLQIQAVSNSKVQDIDLTINAGEILGLLGLMGAGRTELGKTIYGYYPVESGQMTLHGNKTKLGSPAAGLRNKVAYVSEDRKADGLILKLSVKENMVLSALQKFGSKIMRIQKQKEHIAVERFIREFHIKTPGMQQRLGMLSGGNQQKVSIAKALMGEPEILILDEPTRGIDVGARKEIYDLIHRLKKQGLAIILISSEMPEILGLSDRIAVMCNKRITGIFSAGETSQAELLKYATNF